MPEQECFPLEQHEARLAALKSNAKAVRAVASAIESTLGPKGLDTMLVSPSGKVIVTNDGVTIVDRMAVNHPAAKMIVQVAKAQQEEMGDGTTTATLLAAALVEEGVKQVTNGVPVAKVIAGMKRGIQYALKCLAEKSRPIRKLNDEWLKRIAFTASRENEDITSAVIKAAQIVGREKLLANDFKLSDSVVAHPRAENAVFLGVLVNGSKLSKQMPYSTENAKVLVLTDALKPDFGTSFALQTEFGYNKQERLRDKFLRAIENLVHLEVGVILTYHGVDPLAEDILADSGIMVVSHVPQEELLKVAEHTNARPLKCSSLYRTREELASYLGYAALVEKDAKLEAVRVTGGAGNPVATILVSASTEEVVEERERITKDAAAAVQAAVKGGYVPGGGAIELSLAQDVENFRNDVQGLERFGVSVVVEALQRPMTQVVANAGFNPLEKIELVKAYQLKQNSDSFGIDCNRGTVADMVEMGVVDPLLVKFHALRAAGEVSTAILRIHTIVKMKEFPNNTT